MRRWCAPDWRRRLSSSVKSLRTAVIGVSGYSGAELARLLLRHPQLQSTPPLFFGRIGAETESVPLTSMHPQLAGLPNANAASIIGWDWNQLQRDGVELVFLATPHEQSREWVPEALACGIRVVDLSGAWRLHDEQNRAVYKLLDSDAILAAGIQHEAVYGSPELHGAAIARARLVANPGCYATSIILALAPLLRANLLNLDCEIICDSKSGVSGAGKAPTATTHFMHAANNLSAYSVFGHRHTGELLEQLHLQSNQIGFTPHLLPIPRGILSTIYIRLNEVRSMVELQDCFNSFYSNAPLVRVHRSPALPEIQHVVHTNFCDIGFALSPDGKRAVLVSCLDNLLKGAASQAVQNMNLMAGWHEAEGLL